jgi:hypothetical protein
LKLLIYFYYKEFLSNQRDDQNLSFPLLTISLEAQSELYGPSHHQLGCSDGPDYEPVPGAIISVLTCSSNALRIPSPHISADLKIMPHIPSFVPMTRMATMLPVTATEGYACGASRGLSALLNSGR